MQARRGLSIACHAAHACLSEVRRSEINYAYFCAFQVENLLFDRAPLFPANIGMNEIDSLVAFLDPFDLAGSRPKNPSISSRVLDSLYLHVAPDDADSSMIAAMKKVAKEELTIMDAVREIDACKELVAYMNRSGLKNRLSATTKQEVATRWNSHRPMLHSIHSQWDEVRKTKIPLPPDCSLFS